jgi:mannose-6-phosphate isomerase-like protein (cupin superfamily)
MTKGEKMKSTISPQTSNDWLTARPGERFCIRIPATSTNGAYSVTEILASPGDSTPLHVHAKEDEYVIILEGEAQIVYGSETIRVGQGTSFCLKRQIPHAWGNPTNKPLRLLFIATPGGCEEALRLIATTSQIDIPALAAQFQITTLGPPILS